MYIGLVDGERRLPGTADVVIAIEALLPLAAQVPRDTPIVAGTAGNDIIHAGHGGAILFGGAVLGSVRVRPDHAGRRHRVNASHRSRGRLQRRARRCDRPDGAILGCVVVYVNSLTLVDAVEDASGTFAELQINTAAAGKLRMGTTSPNLMECTGARSSP